METFAISLSILIFTAYVAFHIFVLSRLVARKADKLVVAYAVMRMLTFPLLIIGAVLSLMRPSTQAGNIGMALLIAGLVTSITRLIIGRIWMSRQRSRQLR